MGDLNGSPIQKGSFKKFGVTASKCMCVPFFLFVCVCLSACAWVCVDLNT